jgi:hypothetical protein
MPVKTFKFHDESNIDKTINDWADQNKYKIDNISVCPIKWYSSKDLASIIEVELLATVLYHKKRIRKEINNVPTESN